MPAGLQAIGWRADVDPRWREAMGVVVGTFQARDGATAAGPEPARDGARGLFSRVMQGLRPQQA